MANVQPSCTCGTCHLMTIDNTHAKHLQECSEEVSLPLHCAPLQSRTELLKEGLHNAN
jgi:hypothetical protein